MQSQTAWRKLLDDAGMENFRFYDLEIFHLGMKPTGGSWAYGCRMVIQRDNSAGVHTIDGHAVTS